MESLLHDYDGLKEFYHDGGITATGGEPLVRKGAVAFMKALKEMDGVRSVTLTTNGLLLSEALPDLVRMGIDGINISLDSLDERQYASLTGGGELSVVRQALEQAAAQCVNVKVNAVLLAETPSGDNWLLPKSFALFREIS